MKTKGIRTFGRGARPGLLALAFLLAAAGAPAQTAALDAALVTQVTGQVAFRHQEGKQPPAPVQAFMKVRQGDRFQLPGESALTLLYFASGRQETWKGPVNLAAGREESRVEGAKGAPPRPEVKLLPARVSRKMDCAPLPLPRSSVRYSGVIQTMGPLCAEARQELKAAEAAYRSLRHQTPADDFTPELYYLGVLAEYQQYPEMERLLNSMLAKKPGDPALMHLKDWAASQAGKGK